MADMDSLYTALRNADAAGDTEGAKRLAQYIQQVQTVAPVEPPKTTALGHAKELIKGVVPGAVGLLETAATGASALLPEDMEKAARSKIASMATAAKAPFAAAPGYEESVSRRLSEGVGSTIPFFALGPLGPAARAAAAGIGVAAGAGEARQSAEEAGATGKERSMATLLGAPTGLLDILAPEIKPLKGVITTALARGGVEGATEAAQKIAQNLIAKGIYNPNQGVLTGSGEEGAYGAGIGALTSLILDLTIPGRQHVQAPPPKQPPAAQPGPQVPPTAPAGAQGTLFTPEEMGALTAPATKALTTSAYADLIAQRDELLKAEPTPEVRAQLDAIATKLAGRTENQGDLGLDFARTAADATLERERLKQGPQTPEVKARIKELNELLLLSTQSEIEAIRAAKEAEAAQAVEEAKARKKFPGLFNAPDLITAPDEVKARTQGELFPAEELGGEFAGPQVPAGAPERAPAETETEGKGPYQYKLPLRSVREGRTPNRNLEIPARPGELTPRNIMDTNVPISPVVRTWAEENLIGKTVPEVQRMVDKDPTLIEGKGQRAKLLRELLAPQPATFEEPTNGQTPAPIPAVQPRLEPRTGEPSVGVSGEPAAPVVPQPRPRVPRATGRPAAPVGLGLVPAEQPAGAGVTPERAQPPAVINEVPATPPAPVAKPAPAATVAKAPKAPPASAPTQAVEDFPEIPQPPSVQRLANAKTRAEFDAALDDLVRIQRSEAHPDKDAVGEFLGSNVRYKEFERALQAAEERVRRSMPPPEIKEEAAPAKLEGWKAPEPKPEPVAEAKPEPVVKTKPEPVAEAKPEPKAEVKPEVEPARAVKTPEPAAMDMLKAIDGKPMIEAAQWAAKNLPDPDQKVIAQRVVVKLRQLQELGATLEPIKVTDEGRRLIGALGSTMYDRNVKNGQKVKPSSISITLNHPSNGEKSGVTPEVLLHELLHAATLGTIEMGRYKSSAGTKVGDATKDLYALTEAVVRHFNKRIDDKATLTPFEKRVYGGENNALRDSHEILVWALTNRDMQQYMESIPYKGQTAWDKFVTYVRDLLGIPPKADTALSEALRIGDTLLNLTKEDIRGAEQQTGKQFAVSATNADLIKGAGPLDAVKKSALDHLLDGAKSVPTGLSRTTMFRTQTADIAATIEHRLREKFDGAVRDSLGEINPMGLYRQAQDYTKLLLDFFQQGSLVKDPTLGLWRVTENKNVAPPAKVYELIDAYAEKNGYSREEATQVASRVLEAVRLNEMRLANKNEGTSFVIHKINKASTMTADQQIDALMAEYNRDPAFRQMNDVMDQARKELVDHMVAVGRLSAEDGKAWKEVSGYVPFDRMEDLATKFSKVKKIGGKGLAQLGKLPELVGSDIRPVGNVFDNYINTLGWMVRQVTNTDATVQTVKQLESLGYAKKLGFTPQGRDNTVPIYVNGEQVYYELPSKYDVMAFKDLTPPKAGWIRNLAAVSNVLRKTVTVLPPFALKQVTDDVQRAILTSGVKNPGALLYMALTNFPKLALAEMRGIQHPSVKDFGSTGLTGEFDFSTGKPALSLLKDLGYKPRGVFETLLHRLEGITRASDLAVRKAIYDQTMNESKDKLLAETRAREFINFRRRGASDFVGTMVATIPFFNAYIQGMDVLYRAASGKDSSSSVGRAQARQLFWSRAGMMVAFASLYAMGKDDDDKDYNEMDLRVRDSNWILPGGYKIPVPGELGAIFKVIPERVVEYYKRSGTPQEQEAFEAVRTALSFIAEQYVGRIVPVPQAVKPLLEAWANKSFLTGRELEGYHHKTMDPSMRRTESTSELAIAIANFSRDTVGAEVSPIMIDNALRGYFGSTAALTTAITDSLLNPTRVDRPLHKWALLSNYLYDPVGTRQMTEFYEARDKVGKAGATLRELAKTDTDKAVAYAEEHQDVLAFEKAINGTLNQLEKTRAYRKFLNSEEGAKAMSTDEREAEIKQIKETEVEMVKWLREAKVAMRNQ